jgi:hypothetical protein
VAEREHLLQVVHPEGRLQPERRLGQQRVHPNHPSAKPIAAMRLLTRAAAKEERRQLRKLLKECRSTLVGIENA